LSHFREIINGKCHGNVSELPFSATEVGRLIFAISEC
jgi:hypothetical protein